MTLKQLITRLQKDKVEFHDEEVEFIVATKLGLIITMDVQEQAPNIVKALKLFKGVGK